MIKFKTEVTQASGGSFVFCEKRYKLIYPPFHLNDKKQWDILLEINLTIFIKNNDNKYNAKKITGKASRGLISVFV